MNDDQSVSIIIPAFNEQGNIDAAIDSVLKSVEGLTEDYEIIVIDDGSVDQTAAFAQKRAARNSRVKVFSNQGNQGFGYTFKRGVGLAAKEYVTIFPGDNDMSFDSLRDLIKERGAIDLVITHSVSGHRRSLLRRALSKTFVLVMNFLFGLNLKYYNGAFICRTRVLQSIPLESNSLAALAECIVRLIKSGYSYKSIAFEHTGRKSERSKAITLKSFISVGKTVFILMRDVYSKSQYKQKVSCLT